MSKKRLKMWNQYSCEDVHHIFDGETTFAKGAGSCGRHGIVKIPNTKNDYVFLVTFGKKQADHHFIESVSEEGILKW